MSIDEHGRLGQMRVHFPALAPQSRSHHEPSCHALGEHVDQEEEPLTKCRSDPASNRLSPGHADSTVSGRQETHVAH